MFLDWGYLGLRGDGALLRVDRVKVFRPLPERWVVECTLAWLSWNQRLVKDDAYHPEIGVEQMLLGRIHLLAEWLARVA